MMKFFFLFFNKRVTYECLPVVKKDPVDLGKPKIRIIRVVANYTQSLRRRGGAFVQSRMISPC